MFQAWKWERGYLYTQTTPDGEWRKCTSDQTVEYLTECVREAAKIAFEVNTKTSTLEYGYKVPAHTEENYTARNTILAMIGDK